MLSTTVPIVEIKAWIKKSVEENIWRITSDRPLQCFMASAFSLLLATLILGTTKGYFDAADTCYGLLKSLFSGRDISLLPNVLFLIPPYLFSPDQNTFRYLFSLYNFAFYMLGGHFILKCCRLTGYSEKDAYALLFVMFLCAPHAMLQSTGPIAATLVILSIWFFQEKSYIISFTLLALATASGIYPALLFMIYLVLAKDGQNRRDGILGPSAYLSICIAFILIPKIGICQTDLTVIGRSASYLSVLGFDLDMIPSLIAGLAIGLVALSWVIYKTDGRKGTIQDVACLLWTVLVPILLLNTAHTDSFFVWIAMLFPMTQMSKERSTYILPAYGMFVLFCLLSGICFFIPADSKMYDVVMFSSALSLIALWASTVQTYIDTNRRV